VSAAHPLHRERIEQPAEAEHQRRREHHRDQRVDPGRVPGRVGEERGQDQERPVRDVDHTHDAEDQRQARCEQGVRPADQQAEDDRLDELSHPGGRCLT
jgi:hypothetical protein